MKYAITITVIICGLFSFFCGSGSGNTKGIDLSLNVYPDITSYNLSETLTLTDNLRARFHITMQMTDQFEGLDADSHLFIHIWDIKRNKMVFNFGYTFDEPGTKKSSQWRKGDKIEIDKRIFIPKYLKDYGIDFQGFESYNLTIGLYNPKKSDEKLVLLKKALRIEAEESHAPDRHYKSGWHGDETLSEPKKTGFKSFRWIERKAELIINNPTYNRDESGLFLLIVSGEVPLGILKDPSVTIKLNETLLEKFSPAMADFEKEFILKADQLGNQEKLTLSIESDKFFVPSQLNPNVKDKRELGLKIYDIYFRKADR